MSQLFPELDVLDEALGAADLASAAQVARRPPTRPSLTKSGEPVYSEPEVRLTRPGLAAGSESLARFEAAFGLPGLIRSLKQTKDNEIELVVELPGGGLGAAALVPPEARAWRRGRSFGVAFRGPRLPGLLAKALLRFMARYEGVPYEQILAQVVPDPGDEHMLHVDYPESVFYAYAPSSGWRRFLEGTELYRGVCGAHQGKVAVIEHTDIECLYNVAPHDDRLPSFFNAPAPAEALRDDGGLPSLATEVDARRLFTDIRDRDVIRGSDLLLDRALECLADDPDKPELVLIHGGCLPDVTGDDLDASVARTRDKLRLPVIVVGTQNDPLAAAFGQLIEDREITPTRALEANSVALLGVPALAGRAEIDGLLARAKIPVLAELLPNFSPEALDGLTRASVLLVHPWTRHAGTLTRLCQRLAPAKVVHAGSPYGLRGSSRWLRALGQATGRGQAIEALLREQLAAIDPQWRALRARARRYRVGFVIDHSNWREALAPERCVGVPMLPLLREMGFGIDLLIYSRRSQPSEAPQPGDDALGESPREPRVRTYRSCAELDELLAEPGVVAWYSELRYERRLTRNGKTPFSLRQFRMGIRGALASLRELVELAELPFYRRYAPYLGAAFDELEDPR